MHTPKQPDAVTASAQAARLPYDYAVLRVVPRVDREEFVNAGVVVFAKQAKLLAARSHLDAARLQALWPELDLDAVARHLAGFERICRGDAAAGPIAQLSQSERFHWLTAPRSTVLQTSPVRTGVTADLDALVDELFASVCPA